MGQRYESVETAIDIDRWILIVNNGEISLKHCLVLNNFIHHQSGRMNTKIDKQT